MARDFVLGPIKSFFATYWKALAWAFGVVFFGFTVWKNIGTLAKYLSPYLSRNFQSLGQGTPQVSENTALLVAWGLLFLLLMFLVSIFLGVMLARQKKQSQDSTGRNDRLKQSFDQMVDSCRQIVRQTYPGQDKSPAYNCEKVKVTVTIDRNGDGIVEEELTMKAAGKALHYWPYMIFADGNAAAVEFMSDLKFEIKENNGVHKALYLLTKNEPRKKEVAIFHLPRVDPLENEDRRIWIGYKWRGLFTTLLEENKDEWAYELRSNNSVPYFELKIIYHGDLGTLGCNLIGKNPGAHILRAIDNGFPGWQFKMDNAPANGFVYEFQLSREKAT